MSTEELDVGEHTVSFTAVGPGTNDADSITFFIDALGTGACTNYLGRRILPIARAELGNSAASPCAEASTLPSIRSSRLSAAGNPELQRGAVDGDLWAGPHSRRSS